MTFFSRNSFHSFSPQELEISFATRPSQSTVGETWMPFCLENLTAVFVPSVQPLHPDI